MQIPDFTTEEKAAAFDLLWASCHKGRVEFSHYIPKARDERTFERIPVFYAKIFHTGQVDTFGDVLYSLVIESKKKGKS